MAYQPVAPRALTAMLLRIGVDTSRHLYHIYSVVDKTVSHLFEVAELGIRCQQRSCSSSGGSSRLLGIGREFSMAAHVLIQLWSGCCAFCPLCARYDFDDLDKLRTPFTCTTLSLIILPYGDHTCMTRRCERSSWSCSVLLVT
jgi:hypothetical protein